MGGFATFISAATNPQVSCAAAMGGRPAFRKAWDDITLGTSTYDRWAGAMASLQDETAKRGTYLAAIDPFDRLADFHPRPLLMINGDRDVDQPYLYALELYRRLEPIYRDVPGRLKLHMPPIGHEFGPAEVDAVVDWLVRGLTLTDDRT
jgi:fermentation-respiration switch protein FrsA (DUF1100 family)